MTVNVIKAHNFCIKLLVKDQKGFKDCDYLFLGDEIIPSGRYYAFSTKIVIWTYFAFTI